MAALTGRLASSVIAVASVVIGCLLVAVAMQWRNPGLVGRWPLPQCIFAASAAALLLWAYRCARVSRFFATLLALLCLTAVTLATIAGIGAARLRVVVLAMPPSDLHAAAAHVIAGYYDDREARALAEAGVAGLFLSPRNVRTSTADAIAAEIASLQALRHRRGLAPLWIAADQEGGLVATLSPPLPRPPPLAALASDEAALTAEGRRVGAQLARLGVTVNFAPVVDVTRGLLDPADRNSRIARRSLSNDPGVVARGAAAYCRGLEAAGVRCTIKHFPGLGAVTSDTHVMAAHLPTIDPRDLEPFRRLLAAGEPRPWLMLAHLTVDGLDADHPASASPALIGLLRHSLGDGDGILVTDDAAMVAYRAALDTNAASTVTSGADLVLASWNPDIVYEVIAALARAKRSDPPAERAFAASDARLERARQAASMP